ncbi:MAG: uracil-DNA glycosylase [Oscillospiraceae bacterium]|nr:uracil-DNA glycosylase [Oscillospiraceae bacterium]
MINITNENIDDIKNIINFEDEWKELLEVCLNCKKCGLYKTRTNLVFGKGSHSAKIMFIGEAPGETEDREGLPFVGRAGKLLDKYMYYFDFNLENVYIANMLKCRPPNNRDPQESEQDSCIDYLRLQTKLLNPKIIVCLGRISAMRIIKPDFRISSEHGKWFRKGEIHMTAVYHPSALLRDPPKKADALLDFKSVREKATELGLM